MNSVHANVQKFVDKYFLPHFHHHLQKHHCNHKNRKRNAHCNLCQLNSSENAKGQYLINQDDIDLLELMNPKNTAEDYMRNILKLSKKEENIHGAAKRKQVSKIVPTTRKIIETKARLNKSSALVEFNEREEQYEHQQKKQQHFDRLQIARMQQECFIRLGKLIVIRKQTTNPIQLTKANYHTRQFLLGLVKEEVERLSKDGVSKEYREFYLMACANSRGIYFETEKMPSHLGQVLEFSQFRQITCTLNEIIQRTAYQYRLESGTTKKVSPLFIVVWIVMITIVSLMIINGLLIFSQVMAIFSLVASICLVLFILMFNCHRYRQKLAYVPLLDVINLKISDYLDYLNSRPGTLLRWEAAKHLYWIKIIEKKP